MLSVMFVLPPPFFNKDSTGFNEMLASELIAVCNKNCVDYCVCSENPNKKAKLYVLPVQYRDDVFSDWLISCVGCCKDMGGIVLVCGKSSSVEYRYILQHTQTDFVALGECDYTLDDILHVINNTNWIDSLVQIPGISFRSHNSIIKSPKRQMNYSMDDLPFPQYEYLVQKSLYRLCVMETSRSCHGKCNFCEGHLFRGFTNGNDYRVKSPERVISEMKYVIDTYSCRLFSFADDNFFADGENGKKRAIEIANLLIQEKIKAKFTIECRADDVDEEVFKYLKKAGLIKVFIGIESGSQTVLDRYRKGTTVQQNRDAIETLNKLNIACHPGHILFDPKTTPSELHETVDFFEPYLDFLFSFDEGDSNRLLYYPQGCSIVHDFWPNQTNEFYEKIWYSGIQCEFENLQTEKIFQLFCKYISDSTYFPKCNLLKRRILCLKKALSDIN